MINNIDDSIKLNLSLIYITDKLFALENPVTRGQLLTFLEELQRWGEYMTISSSTYYWSIFS